MAEIVEIEWLERNRYTRGKPVGFRQYKTEFEAIMTMEGVILAVTDPMIQRNQIKIQKNDQGIFYQEVLEEVFLDQKDGFWRYVVSMGYISADNEVRKKCQEKIANKQLKQVLALPKKA